MQADAEAHNWLDLVPHSVLIGQASGTAAALAVRHGIQPRDVNIRELKTYVKTQNIYLEQACDPDVTVTFAGRKTEAQETDPAEDLSDMVSDIVNKS